MESYNQTFNKFLHSNDTCTKEVPLFVTYLNMVVILMVTTVVIYPAVIVINVIWKTRELHTKCFFFVANLLTTNIGSITVQSILQYFIMILYLLDMNTSFAGNSLKWSALLVVTMFHLMTVMLPITLAAERIIVIGFPFCHRSIMTTKTVAIMLTVMWGLSIILAIMIGFIVPIDIVWPLALVDWNILYIPFIVTPQITSAVFIMAANVFFLYKVVITNRKARENEELTTKEAKRFRNLAQMLRAQIKPTITLFLAGGVDVMANIMIPVLYLVIGFSVDPLTKVYIEQFFLYPLRSSLLLSHSLVYGFYMKRIRKRLPNCKAGCYQRNILKSRVVTLHQQP